MSGLSVHRLSALTIHILRPKKICVWGNMAKKRGSVGRFFFGYWSLTSACTSFMYFETDVDANISCVRFGARDL